MKVGLQRNEPVKEAIKFTGENVDELVNFMELNNFKDYDKGTDFGIRTENGFVKIEKNDFLVKDGNRFFTIKGSELGKEYRLFIPYIQFFDSKVELIPFKNEDVNPILRALSYASGQLAVAVTSGIEDTNKRAEEIYKFSNIIMLNVVGVAIDTLKKQGVQIELPKPPTEKKGDA